MAKEIKVKKIGAKLKTAEFDALRIKVASPDEILAWSFGEVTKPETINYRTQKPEREGLFDERIFGPVKDYECYCGKYKKIRYKGIVCDKCGVEITRSSVRRERMGHIDLAVPVAHIWYLRGVPSILSLVMDIGVADLERIIYFASYIVLEINEEVQQSSLLQLEDEFKKEKKKYEKEPEILQSLNEQYKKIKDELTTIQIGRIISEARYNDLSLKYGQIVKVGIGAEAIYTILKNMDADKIIKQLEEEVKGNKTNARRKVLKRLQMLKDMQLAGIKPSWLIVARLPVIPPDLRPMVQLDGGRFAASDLNDLYRRVINRNNRLKKLINQGAPEVICRNEKRMLQEAVDALIDNSAKRGRAVTTAANRKLRSLSDVLRGKQGRFRQNLLGKRVDYSGRSVIVIGPELKLHQCGLPKMMALELFKTFVISKLISEGYVHNVKNATRMVERGDAEVWDILEQITSNYHVMLNRAPTLHRLGIQAFQPVLIEGKAIQVHPLVCYAFNADFDGDQMAVHVPLSEQAKKEAGEIMLSTHNLLKPASGEPVISARLDIVLGSYYLTSFGDGLKGEGKIFSGKNEAIYAYQLEVVHARAKIKVRVKNVAGNAQYQLIETSVGRILFNNILPEEMQYINEVMDSKRLKRILAESFKRYGSEKTAEFSDRIKDLGFEFASLSGITISMADIEIPKNKKELLADGEKLFENIDEQYRRGLITENEKSLKTIELWSDVKDKLEGEIVKTIDPDGSISMMVNSGARGSIAQITQLSGMKGLVVNPTGEIIELPIRANYKEGLDVLEYFISTHGARKGKSDTSLRTSDAGYLTRRLVDVAQDIVISMSDCGTQAGLEIVKADYEEENNFISAINGRIALGDIVVNKKILVQNNELINDKTARAVWANEASLSVSIRTPLGCKAPAGLCQKCYGLDLATGELVKIGQSVGIMAAQAIGEPGTQLTMKTFHLGGVSGEDITTGLPRVEELFEARNPKTPAVISEIRGRAIFQKKGDFRLITITSAEKIFEEYELPKDYKAVVVDGDLIKAKQALAVAEGKKAVRSAIQGKVKLHKDKIEITSTEFVSCQHKISALLGMKVSDGEMVEKGQILTEGHLNLEESLRLRGKEATQKYIIGGIEEIYASQGQLVNVKHIEVIVRQMFSKARILDEGDSEYILGQIENLSQVAKTSAKMEKTHKHPLKYEPVVSGVTRVALTTASFLSAASFQETTSVLINAAIRGSVDRLNGLKENVIIGKLIPAGTGYRKV